MFWAAIILSEAVTRGVLWKRNLCQSLFFNKVTCLRSATLLKKRLRCRCFPTNFVKFLITPFPTEHLRWLLLFCHFYSDQRFINRKYDEPLFFCSRFVGTTILKVIFLWCIIAKSFSCADFQLFLVKINYYGNI